MIEFRGMAGTLDPGLVSAQASVCGAIVHATEILSPVEFRNLVEQLMLPKLDSTLPHFLHCMRELAGLGTDGKRAVLRLMQHVNEHIDQSPEDVVGASGFIEA